MLTQPMTSFTGFVTYLRYVAGTAKGGVGVGDMFNSVYSMGKMDEDRMRYTSAAVVDSIKYGEVDGNDKITLNWTPVASIHKVTVTDKDGNIVKEMFREDDGYTVEKVAKIRNHPNTDPAEYIQTVTLTTPLAEGQTAKVFYFYDNVEIPQSVRPTSLPTLKAQMTAVALQAHARRIAIYYSQISAFQAKNDYGFDLGDQLAQQAQGELAYEIDTEGVMMLYKGAEKMDDLTYPAYDGGTLQGISRSQYYEGFSEIINRASAILYQRTQKFTPNYMVAGANVLTILPFLRGWNAAPRGIANGPYFAGTLDGIKVYVSPAIDANDFFFGVNGSDLQTSAAVYAPYMAVVPTQLLGFPDGTMSQGFSTMYDMKLLSTYNLEDKNQAGKANAVRVDAGVDANGVAETGTYSWLLVGGSLEYNAQQALRIMGYSKGDAEPVYVQTM